MADGNAVACLVEPQALDVRMGGDSLCLGGGPNFFDFHGSLDECFANVNSNLILQNSNSGRFKCDSNWSRSSRMENGW